MSSLGKRHWHVLQPSACLLWCLPLSFFAFPLLWVFGVGVNHGLLPVSPDEVVSSSLRL